MFHRLAVIPLLVASLIQATPLTIPGYPHQNFDRDVDRRADGDKKVFAHYMVGLTSGQSASQWQQEITQAKNSGIDGFALNIGPADSWTNDQVNLAYTAAGSTGFTLFLSFDMAVGDWSVKQVVDLINTVKGKPAQYKVSGKPLVSTFEGPAWSANWQQVRDQTGGIFLVPDWASLGAAGVGGKKDLIDGAFNWGAWPQPGQTEMTTGEDKAYKSALAGKPYMMGVSPWFYTNLPQYKKNWYSSSESLWFDRWTQVLSEQPQYVQIITWNDFGESSHIVDVNDKQVVAGADYAKGLSHAAWRFVLPYFIRAYKTGETKIDKEGAVAWYRTSPAKACSDGGTVWGQGGTQSASDGAKDVISIIAATQQTASIQVEIGGASQTVQPKKRSGLMSYYEVSFSGKTGAVKVTLNGKSVTGPSISNSCPLGKVNFNPVAIQL